MDDADEVGRSRCVEELRAHRDAPGLGFGEPVHVHDATSRPATPRGYGFAAMATRDAACHCGQLRLEVAGVFHFCPDCGSQVFRRSRRRRNSDFDPIRAEPDFEDLIGR